MFLQYFKNWALHEIYQLSTVNSVYLISYPDNPLFWNNLNLLKQFYFG